MKKLQELSTNEQFKEMESMLRKVYSLKHLDEESLKMVEGLESEGFYSVLSDEAFATVPFGERWYVKYEVTYHMSVLLLDYYNKGHEEVYDRVVSCLRASLSKGYKGHGYDANSICLNYLIKLYKAGLNDIISDKYLNIKEDIEEIVNNFRERYASGNTRDGFGDLKEQIEILLPLVDKDYLFVYGTLMDTERNWHYMLDSKYVGEGKVKGYELLQLKGYPGMIDGDKEVRGQVYIIDEETKKDLDILEGPSYSYEGDLVYVGNKVYYAKFYKFKMRRGKQYDLAYTNKGKWANPDDYVWYVSYGSNILEDRFLEYIYKCDNKQLPIASKCVIIPHNTYYAYNSSRWNHEGVSFLDYTQPGFSYGYMYLITKEQFKQVHKQEGAKLYGKEIQIAKDNLGIPMVTFTSEEKLLENKPSKEYLEVIGAGLKQRYVLEDEEILAYLSSPYEKLDCTIKNIKNILKRLKR